MVMHVANCIKDIFQIGFPKRCLRAVNYLAIARSRTCDVTI